MNAIMRSADKYGYSHSYHDAADLERYGCGDCWAMSDYLFQKMSAAHINVRIVEYATAYSSNHKSVQIIEDGKWVNAPHTKPMELI